MRKISNKIAFAMILLTFAISISLGIALYFQSKALIKIEAEHNLMTTLDREARIVNAEFLRVKRLSLVIKSLVESTIDIEKAQTQTDYMEYYKKELSSVFIRLLGDFENVSNWILFNSKVISGVHTVSYTYEEGQFVRETEYDVINDGFAGESWWQDAIAKGENWTEPYYWEPWHSDVISYSVPVFSKDTLIGVAGAELFLNAFQSRLENIKIYKSGYVMLITDTGKEIYYPEGTNLKAFKNWYSENREFIQNNPTGLQHLHSEGREEIIAWQLLDNGWLLIARPRSEEMFSGLASLNLITGIIFLLSLPLSLGMSIWISKTLTKRLTVLTQVAEAMLDHHEIQPVDISGKDEIATLSHAFNQMQQNVKTTLFELKLNEAKYRSLVENSSNLIYTMTTSGNLTTTNQIFETTVGKTKSELMGLHFTCLFGNTDLAIRYQEAFDKVLKTKQQVEITTEIDTNLGNMRTLTSTLIPIFDEQHQLLSIIGNSADITERIQTEKEIARLLSEENDQLNHKIEQKTIELESAMKEIMEADKIFALSILVAGVAHEVNTPLGNAIALNSLLERNLESYSHKFYENNLSRSSLESFLNQSEEAISGISRNLNKTATLINNFKYLSTSSSTETKTPIELQRLIQFTINSLMNSSDFPQIHYELNCPELLTIETCPGALTQVLTNLIFNAVEHGLANIEKPLITVDVFEEVDHVQIKFKDNGLGMTPDIVKHIFEPFFTTKRSKGNSGLGLSIVFMKVTGILNSRITCESQPGNGTTFTITLPKN